MGCTVGKQTMTFDECERMVQRKRQGIFYVGVHLWNGFAYPELIVDERSRAAAAAAVALVLSAFPLLVLYHTLQRALDCLRDPMYRCQCLSGGGGLSGLFSYASGPWCWLESFLEYVFGAAAPVHASPDELRRATGETVVVVDDFYADPDRARRFGLAAPMGLHEKCWFSTAKTTNLADLSVTGADDVGFDVEAARRRFAAALGRAVDPREFERDVRRVSCWSGAFHAKYGENLLATTSCAIHTHGEPEMGDDGFAAIVYLDEGGDGDDGDDDDGDDGGPQRQRQGSRCTGTSFWARRSTGMMRDRRMYDGRPSRFRCMLRVPSQFNRAVIAPAAMLHRGERGYGATRDTCRLFQTFFFRVTSPPAKAEPALADAGCVATGNSEAPSDSGTCVVQVDVPLVLEGATVYSS